MTEDKDRIRMTAEDAYVTEYLRAQDLVTGIEEHLRDLPAPTDEFHPHWGHVGDLREINRQLEGIVDFMSDGQRRPEMAKSENRPSGPQPHGEL